MTGETKSSVSGWTIDTMAVHHAALREADEKFQAERDRRYKEIRELEDKHSAELKEEKTLAMELARNIQTYKDVKANELREQLGKERLDYASKLDLKASVEKLEETLKPVLVFVANQQGRSGGQIAMWGWIVAGITLGILVINFITKQGVPL